MLQIKTIESVNKIFDTPGSSPLLVFCDDFNFWVCKYDRFPIYLFNELIASEFAKIWRIKVPETSLITVKKEHIPEHMIPRLQPRWFRKECFGSLYIEGAKEIDYTTFSLFKDKKFRDRVRDKSDFLKIALFDIWLSNEDRSHNNFNLLLHTSQDRFSFIYAIDHVAIFNSANLNREPCIITEDDTILNTELARLLFTNNTRTKQYIDELVRNFYICISECEQLLPEILLKIPASWDLNILDLKNQLNRSIFNPAWLKECEITFRQYLKYFILN
ncbi:HipA family kinase [Chryseobacterium gleum]|uniref:HipA family kinase n=1 Tax=Chryseobacterium gleum TaxID=250 RepID=UPI001E409ACB|nr:HipA family kinase [Chryseobacterium gleum]MCD9617650.1 hypothetical protein [Chryseobacterium gleum]